MAGITNRDEHDEQRNQQRVEARKDELPNLKAVNRPRKVATAPQPLQLGIHRDCASWESRFSVRM
jgi:hypothetical protein